MSRYQLANGNVICAEQSFIDANHPGAVLLPDVLAQEAENAWWIHVGPFKDRLGMDGLAIAASTHPACMAAKEMLYDRKYVNLKGAQIAALLDILIANSQPAADPVFPGSGPMTAEKKATILTTPVPDEDRYKG